jgi:hypothetical protein
MLGFNSVVILVIGDMPIDSKAPMWFCRSWDLSTQSSEDAHGVRIYVFVFI